MRQSGTAGLVAALAVVGVLVGGCADDASEYRKSFIDRHGRVCTYVLTVESEEEDVDQDVSDLECEFPPR